MIGPLSIVALVILALLLIITLFIYGIRKLHKKGYKKTANTVSILTLSLVAFIIYTALYPLDSFYKEEFETDLKQPLPVSAQILRKSASYPDIHGHYEACFAMRLTQKDYTDLRNKFVSNYAIDSILGFECYTEIMEKYNAKNVIAVYTNQDHWTGKYIYLLFFNDYKTIVFYRGIFIENI